MCTMENSLCILLYTIYTQRYTRENFFLEWISQEMHINFNRIYCTKNTEENDTNFHADISFFNSFIFCLESCEHYREIESALNSCWLSPNMGTLCLTTALFSHCLKLWQYWKNNLTTIPCTYNYQLPFACFTAGPQQAVNGEASSKTVNHSHVMSCLKKTAVNRLTTTVKMGLLWSRHVLLNWETELPILIVVLSKDNL